MSTFIGLKINKVEKEAKPKAEKGKEKEAKPKAEKNN